MIHPFTRNSNKPPDKHSIIVNSFLGFLAGNDLKSPDIKLTKSNVCQIKWGEGGVKSELNKRVGPTQMWVGWGRSFEKSKKVKYNCKTLHSFPKPKSHM